MHLRRFIVSLSLGAMWTQEATALPLAYVTATSTHDRETTPERYHPLNLVDDDPNTSWCEGQDDLGEGAEVRFAFKSPQSINKIAIGPSATTGRVIKMVTLSDGETVVRIPLGDRYVSQKLPRSLRGTTYVLRIETVGPAGANPELAPDTACLADVLLYQGNRLYGLKGKLPHKVRYRRAVDEVLGRWSGEPLGASEKFMLFALDGTWTWTGVPLLGGKVEKKTGQYRFRGNRLLMRRGESGRWADMRYNIRRVRVDPDEISSPTEDYEQISLNEALGRAIEGRYHNARL